MGKANRKFRKKQERIEVAARQEENSLWETSLQEQMEEGRYDKAIETLAELVKGNDLQPKFMYDAAYCYFMTGDYERAATWINNTLSFEPNHLDARILLARLLILEERVDDGLAVFDFVLDKWQDSLTEEKAEEIEDIVEFYGRNDRGRIIRDYPHIAAFLALEGETAGAGKETPEGPKDLLAKLKERVASISEPVKDVSAAVTEKAKEKTEEVRKKPTELLQALKQKLARANGAADTPPDEPEKTSLTAKEMVGNKPVASAETVTEEDAATSAEKKRQEILSKEIFASEKVVLLNSFAAAYYYQKQPGAALILLKEALRQAAPTDELLRNLVLVELDLGNRETAMQCAARMKVADFSLLRILRDET